MSLRAFIAEEPLIVSALGVEIAIEPRHLLQGGAHQKWARSLISQKQLHIGSGGKQRRVGLRPTEYEVESILVVALSANERRCGHRPQTFDLFRVADIAPTSNSYNN